MITDKNAESDIISDEKSRIVDYWTKRSHGFAELRKRERDSSVGKRWFAELLQHMPEGPHLRILDIGTGSGFFAFLLCEQGHEVTGIDLTPAMIAEANQIKKTYGSTAEFLVMDAENLKFPDAFFDVILSRNVTWTLPHPEKAYREWYRVLKKGGVILNFDANYGGEDFTGKEEQLPAHHAHQDISESLMRECMNIKNQLEISRHSRPAWDVEILSKAGFKRMEIQLDISERIYTKVDEFYNPAQMFLVKAVK